MKLEDKEPVWFKIFKKMEPEKKRKIEKQIIL